MSKIKIKQWTAPKHPYTAKQIKRIEKLREKLINEEGKKIMANIIFGKQG